MKKAEFLSMNLTELAEKTEINKGTLCKYFSPNYSDNPGWKNIEKISVSLNLSAEKVMEYIKARRNQNSKLAKKKVSDKQHKLIKVA